MQARLSILASDIHCVCEGAEHRIPLTGASLETMAAWTEQYRHAVRFHDPEPLMSTGAALFAWLDTGGWATRWANAPGERTLEIAVQECGSAASKALLDLPWELLARDGDFLAADASQPFVVYRSIGCGSGAAPAEPRYRDLALLFLAAAPEGQHELDFEAEEAAILEATVRLPVQVTVEESGAGLFLKDRIAQDGPFEVVHISCHGDIVDGHDPVLALETPEGRVDLTTPGDLAGVLGCEKASLVFLSACRTAESENEGGAVVEPYVRELVRTGIPNALGWDGSVYDADAIDFARVFYGELAEHAPVPFAVAMARHSLIQAHLNDPEQGRHWHLARVYTGPSGAGACCRRDGGKRKLRKDAGFKEFLDKQNSRVPVATAREFVGRRRLAQAVLLAFKEDNSAGVLLFGMGNLGKSSFAARIANRMPKHQTVVVYDRYDALAVFDQLVGALPAAQRREWNQMWRDGIANEGGQLGDALEAMLDGPFDDAPILLVIDDLEQILERPQPGQAITPVADAPDPPDGWRASLGAVLRAFQAANTASRLLLTSRYDFTLPDGRGGDWAKPLTRVQLYPMRDQERVKQWEAAQRATGRKEMAPAGDANGPDEIAAELAKRAFDVAGGNPGLQEILCRPLLAGEFATAEAAHDAVEAWKATGEVPTEASAAQEAFERLTLETYRDALTDGQRIHLRAATLFSEDIPVPLAALEAVGAAAGAGDACACLARLVGLGLVDTWESGQYDVHAAANPLARPLAGAPLTEEEQHRLATAAMPRLSEAWRDEDGDFPYDARSVEAARLALMGGATADIIKAVAEAAGGYLFRVQHDATSALAILQAGFAKLQAQNIPPEPDTLRLAAQCAKRIGERSLQIAFLEEGLALPSGDKAAKARLAVEHAEATIARDGPEKALQTLHEAASLFREAGDVRSRAVTMGNIADILQQRGETDEALRIRKEEELPVYERLGDVFSRAVTMGNIADILEQRGETDEALRIRKEEQLPVYERLGDVRSRAVTMGQIADILEQRGETDEALRIRKEEELPVYERLGDVRSRAVTMGKIAGILQQRGETDEALRIRKEEQLPVYERLGDVRSRAVTMGKIAGILQQRGETDEALRIRKEEQLPVYERLGDVFSRAVTMGNIADILQQRGETDEALRIRKEEELPVYERLGDVFSRAVTMGNIADILEQRGETDEALRIRKEEQLPVYERLGDVRSRAVTMGQIADILEQRGETDEALRIRKEEELPVYVRLGDVRSRAVTMGKIAGILQQRGETDEALRIRKEEQLPVYERLGDVRSRAVTMGKIAGILQQRGETDEALRIRKEEQLPVYERLGDVFSRAVTMGNIADILEQRGETDEALRIRKEEELPVYERLGDVRSRAVTMGQIADILEQRGETDEALRIRKEEELPVYERLGDVRSRAVTMGKIAGILEQRGETDEALRIRKEEQLPVYERLGDVRSRAVTMGQIAGILEQRGETDEALRIRKEEELPVYERLGDVRSRAVTMGQIAGILQQRGETDEALRIRKEEELPVYERLGDVRSRAVTMGQIAGILEQRGETDEALRIHIEERLPVAEAMQDTDSVAHVRFSCAQIRLNRGGLEAGEAHVIVDELAESFALWKKLQRVDGIAMAGFLLGQVLAGGGPAGEALAVLDESAAAFDKLGRAEHAAQVRTLQAQIRQATP